MLMMVHFPNSLILKENESGDGVMFGETHPGTRTGKYLKCLRKSSEVFMEL